MRSRYLNMLMRNYPLHDSDSEIYIKMNYTKKQKGGININDIPTGGFPPIYLCQKSNKNIIKNTEREYLSKNIALSIKEIMEKRRDVKPFISK